MDITTKASGLEELITFDPEQETLNQDIQDLIREVEADLEVLLN